MIDSIAAILFIVSALAMIFCLGMAKWVETEPRRIRKWKQRQLAPIVADPARIAALERDTSRPIADLIRDAEQAAAAEANPAPANVGIGANATRLPYLQDCADCEWATTIRFCHNGRSYTLVQRCPAHEAQYQAETRRFSEGGWIR